VIFLSNKRISFSPQIKVYPLKEEIGTDSNGNYFGSAGIRFSRFRQYALPDLTDTLQLMFGGGARPSSPSGGIILTRAPSSIPTHSPTSSPA
jgi:hypothetical protein